MARWYYGNENCERKVPSGYKKQNGCFNCRFRFEKREYDDPIEYFCHIDKSFRPTCGSVAMEETWGDYCDTVFDDVNSADQWNWEDRILRDNTWSMFSHAFDLWAAEHYVDPCGICDKWEEDEELNEY